MLVPYVQKWLTKLKDFLRNPSHDRESPTRFPKQIRLREIPQISSAVLQREESCNVPDLRRTSILFVITTDYPVDE